MRELGYEFVISAEAKKNEEKGGIASIILGQEAWFDAWMEGEKPVSLSLHSRLS